LKRLGVDHVDLLQIHWYEGVARLHEHVCVCVCVWARMLA
jgi:aryl-alcohol dehydrogenase-like predicted oxidoreductase